MGINKKNKYLLNFVFIFMVLFNVVDFKVKAVNSVPDPILYLGSNETVKDTIFNGDDLAKPGYKFKKEFYISNKNNYECLLKNIAIDGKLFNISGKILKKDSEEYKHFMDNCIIKFYSEDKEIYSDKLSDFINLDFSNNLDSNIEANDIKKYAFEFYLSDKANNSIMGIKYKFDLKFNFDGVDVEKNGSDSNLIQTGYFYDYRLAITLGMTISAVGLMLVFRRKSYNSTL